MKRIALLLLIAMIFSCGNGYTQDIPEGATMIDENTIIKDESGNKVELPELMEIMNSKEWILKSVKDDAGNLLYLQLTRASEEEIQMMSKMPTQMESSEMIGTKAPTFKMKDLNGNIITSESTIGKVVVLNFWFVACKPCIEEIPELNEVYDRFKSNKDVVFASITFEKLDDVKSFLKKHPISYPVVSDANNLIQLFQVSGFPTNLVIDKNGNYSDLLMGGSPNIGQEISRSIEKALNSKQ